MDIIAIWAFATVFAFGQHSGNGQILRSTSPLPGNQALFKYGLNLDTVLDRAKSSLNVNLDVTYFGSNYKTLTISRDGVLSFGSEVSHVHDIDWPAGVLHTDDQPFIAPFLLRGRKPIPGDNSEFVYYRVISKSNADPIQKNMFKNLDAYLREAVINTPALFNAKVMVVVTWVGMSDSPTAATTTRASTRATTGAPKNTQTATFQAVVVCDGDNTFVIFNYQKLELSRQKSYLAGFNGGYGRGWHDVIPCHGKCTKGGNPLQTQDLVTLKGSDYVGRFVFNVGQEQMIRGGCLSNQLAKGIMERHPQRVDMFGGEKLRVSGMCMSKAAKFYCKFGDTANSPITDGVMVNEMQGFCPVPILTRRGPVLVSWSSDKKNWASSNYISSVLNGRMEPTVHIDKSTRDNWRSRNATDITVEWTPKSFSNNSTARIQVRLVGYREDEAKNKIEFRVLEEFGGAENSAGTFTFQVAEHRCRSRCEEFDEGLLEVALEKGDHREATDRVALRFGVIPIGWYVNDQLTAELGPDWSDQKCRAWNREDRKDQTWLNRLLRCPCNLDQALSDFGRWQVDPGCNLFAGSVCEFHKQAKHCVRSVVPTVDGSGNQCCYNHDGTLRYSELSYQGSTPDRGHAWGAAPYDKPNFVPDFSHWRHDVISFYYCCLWNDYKLCDLYMELRSTTDCSTYDVPSLSFIRGDPHVTTLDGQQYNFGGAGDFWLLRSPMVKLQGRFMDTPETLDIGKPTGTSVISRKPTALVCLAVEGQGEIVQVCPAPRNSIQRRGIDIRVGKDRTFFLSKSSMWQDFKSQAVVNNVAGPASIHHDNFTILLANNVGVKVSSSHGMLYVTVALPPTEKKSSKDVQGLLKGNSDGVDGFVSRSGTLVTPSKDGRTLYGNFGLSWNVSTEESLFSSHYKVLSVGKYLPYFKASDIPRVVGRSPNARSIASICHGNSNCEWDYITTGSQEIAKNTMKEEALYDYIAVSADRKDNCGLPNVGRMAVMSSNNFSVGMEVKVTGCNKGKIFTGEVSFRCVREDLTSSTKTQIKEGIRQVEKNGQEYVLHWVPSPSPVCLDDHRESSHDDDDDEKIIIGVVTTVAVIAAIAIIVMVVIFIRKRKAHGDYV